MTIEINRDHQIEDDNLTGFVICAALFISGLLANMIIAAKLVEIGPIAIPSSAFLWAMTFPISDIVAEVYGRRYARKMVLGGFIGLVLFYFAIQTSIAMPAASFWHNQEAYVTTLSSSSRVTIGVFVSYLIVQFIDVFLFGWIRAKTGGKYLWLRNNLSTLISQTCSNTIFLLIAFWGTIPVENWVHLYITNLLVRYALLAFDTPFVYAGVYSLYYFYPKLKEE